MLFEDKREVELVWNGETCDVCTTVLPFKGLEHVNGPRKDAKASPQFEMFDPRGRTTAASVASAGPSRQLPRQSCKALKRTETDA